MPPKPASPKTCQRSIESFTRTASTSRTRFWVVFSTRDACGALLPRSRLWLGWLIIAPGMAGVRRDQ